MPLHLLLVAVGGAAGSVMRYLVGLMSQQTFGDGFPWGTLTVNVTGCLAIASLHTLLLFFLPVPLLREDARVFLLVGVLGGFTTFSSFGLETLALVQSGRYAAAGVYVLLSNALGLAAAGLGLWLTKIALAPAGP